MLRIGIKDRASHSHFGGYGQLSREIIKSLLLKYDIRIIGKRLCNIFPENLYLEAPVADFDQHFDIVLHISSPKEFNVNPKVKNLIYTQNALGDLPANWIEFLKPFDHIVVPGKFDKTVYDRYFKSVFICPQLVDNTAFKPIPKWRSEGDDIFTFIFIGSVHYRKGFDLLVKALSNAAQKIKKPMKLIAAVDIDNIKSNLNYFVNLNVARSKYLTIDYQIQTLDPAWMNRLYNRCDAFITLSRGEGWCMPAHESLLAGKPIIVPDSTAFQEYLNFLPGVLPVKTKPVFLSEIKRNDHNLGLLNKYTTEKNVLFEPSIEDCSRQIIGLTKFYDSYRKGAFEARDYILDTYNHTNTLANFDRIFESIA